MNGHAINEKGELYEPPECPKCHLMLDDHEPHVCDTEPCPKCGYVMENYGTWHYCDNCSHTVHPKHA